jgi:hypothetical protein
MHQRKPRHARREPKQVRGHVAERVSQFAISRARASPVRVVVSGVVLAWGETGEQSELVAAALSALMSMQKPARCDRSDFAGDLALLDSSFAL